jgi:hypothetical protein
MESKSDDEELWLIQSTIKKFTDILLQADAKTVIPLFFELDMKNKSIPDISANFDVSAIDSFASV